MGERWFKFVLANSIWTRVNLTINILMLFFSYLKLLNGHSFCSLVSNLYRNISISLSLGENAFNFLQGAIALSYKSRLTYVRETSYRFHTSLWLVYNGSQFMIPSVFREIIFVSRIC